MQNTNKDDLSITDLKKDNRSIAHKTSRRSARIVIVQSLYHYQLNDVNMNNLKISK